LLVGCARALNKVCPGLTGSKIWKSQNLKIEQDSAYDLRTFFIPYVFQIVTLPWFKHLQQKNVPIHMGNFSKSAMGNFSKSAAFYLKDVPPALSAHTLLQG
jgi:hypothetical protein